MRVESAETSLVVIDRPIVERLFGVFSAIVGGVSAWLCFRFYAPGGDWGDVVLALLAPFLLLFAIAGVWRLLTLPTMTCHVDGTRRTVELKRRAPVVRRDMSWRFDDVADIRAGGRPGSDNESGARLLLVLLDGRHVALTQHPGTDRAQIEAIAAAARRMMTRA